MFNQIISILNIVVSSIKDFWPYLLATIPLTVFIQMSGVAKYIKNALQVRPYWAILLATIVGAFSPFCSCGVIPVIVTLLMSGVPLAPVMSFWIASPSMDPEIFFLSVATIGWNLAVWRLISTFFISLSAGLITHFIVHQKWFDEKNIIRSTTAPMLPKIWELPKPVFIWTLNKLKLVKENLAGLLLMKSKIAISVTPNGQTLCCPTSISVNETDTKSGSNSCEENTENCGCDSKSNTFWEQLIRETWNASYMLLKFKALAFILKALIILYIPSEWIVGLLGRENVFSILMATVLGIPMYTGNLAALPMISGLLVQGMNPAAALAFLIAGPTTTLPAMAAVWGITNRRVFALYLSFSLFGALFFGYLYSITSG